MSSFARFLLSAALVLLAAAPAAAQRLTTDSPFSNDGRSWLEELSDIEINAEDFAYTVGVGIGVTPDFPGSGEHKLGALPLFQVNYKDVVTLNPLGLRVRAWRNDRVRLRLGIGLSQGRSADDESPVSLLPKVKMGGSLDATLEGRIVGPVAFRLNAKQGFAGGHKGTTLSSSLGVVWREKDKFSVIPEIALTWAGNNYMDAFFTVTPAGAAASGLSAYDAGAGFRDVALRVLAQYHFNTHWSVLVRGEAAKLLGDARDSSIVREAGKANQGTLGLGVLYTF